MTESKSTSIRAMKGRERIAALTAYDFPTAKRLDDAGIPFILVGDSVGMVVLGYPDTTHVTMAEMEHHVRAVARAKPRALLAADLPYHSYETPESAVENARRLVAAGAEAIKAEGGREIAPQIRAIVGAGIPFCAHLGMLPQSVLLEGGYHVKGKAEAERAALLADAQAVTEAGAFAVVLELVTASVAREITQKIAIPTIGIGAGPDCDGEILVVNDLLGISGTTFPSMLKNPGAWGNKCAPPWLNGKRALLNTLVESIFMRTLFLFLMLITLSGCVSKSEANLKAREAFVAGQQQAMAAAQKAIPPNTVAVHGNVKNESIPWTEDLTVGKAILAADYQGLVDPRRIVLIRDSQSTDINPRDLLQGQDMPVQAGDVIELVR